MSDKIKNILTTFIAQSKSDDLKTKHFPKSFFELSMRVSFGQGANAKIPWISFLGINQTTSKGIYPVYLLYKKYR